MNGNSELYSQLIQRYYEHKNWAEKKIKWYKPLGYVLAISIPIIAALITALLAKDNECLGWSCGATYFSLTLAFLSILQSTLKPNERFIFFSGICIELEEWYLNYKIEYEQKIKEYSSSNSDTGNDQKVGDSSDKNSTDQKENIFEFFKNQNKLLSEIGRKMAIQTLPSGKK